MGKTSTKDLIDDKKVENIFELIGTGRNFLNRTLRTQALRSTSNMWDCSN